EMVERLADPLLAGVYGGEAEKLSARAVLPRLVEMEARYGSLSRALLRAKSESGRTGSAPPPPLFTSLRNGMQQLVEAVTARLDPAGLCLGQGVRRVARQGNHWLVSVERGQPARFDGVILALPAYAAAELLEESAAALPAKLREILYSSSITVTLGYDAAAAHRSGFRLPPGFGCLVPRSEGRRMLACTFVHQKFPHRAPPGRWLLRAFLGGSADESALQLDDQEIQNLVCRELKDLLGLGPAPDFVRIFRWPRSMAQYEVGHLKRVAEIERLRALLPGLYLAGNAYGGVGVPDCVRSGRAAARAAATGAGSFSFPSELP
ncbi:MAG: protoporphyrinogen oxidase, partial [Terriglobales bacterium]